jgi:hypothetical protein
VTWRAWLLAGGIVAVLAAGSAWATMLLAR